MIKVVCNSSPIIALSNINQINLLLHLFDEVVIPTTVYEEVTKKSRHGKNELIHLVKENKVHLYQVKDNEM